MVTYYAYLQLALSLNNVFWRSCARDLPPATLVDHVIFYFLSGPVLFNFMFPVDGL